MSGPNGIVIYNEVLYLVNQNANTAYNGSVMAFAVPESVKFGKLEASQLPFQRLFPDPIDVFAEYSPFAPRGLVIGASQLIYCRPLSCALIDLLRALARCILHHFQACSSVQQLPRQVLLGFCQLSA